LDRQYKEIIDRKWGRREVGQTESPEVRKKMVYVPFGLPDFPSFRLPDFPHLFTNLLYKAKTMYENKREPLASKNVYYRRMTKNLVAGIVILFLCLLIGVTGYHYTSGIRWLDSLHNASMILSGMGPVVEIKSVQGKWFSFFYALFSGVVFITNIGFMLTPAIHRFFHKLHVEVK
jgi:hypothetical protein